jgi:DNA repair exonuclease SbcCD ATPase subunit
MQALEKITLAYLALQERADKLQADKDAMQQDLADLQHKYKTAKEQKAFLQTERNKWFDAYNLLDKSNGAQTVEQAEEIRNLKACIEELESQLVALTPKEQRIDEPTDGYEAEKRVCRQDFKASGDTLPETMRFKEECEGSAKDWENAKCRGGLTGKKVYFGDKTNETTEKAGGTTQPVILLANQYGDWVHGKTLNSKEQTELLFTPDKQLADQFATLREVKDFLDDYPIENIIVSYRHPQTLKPFIM